MASHATGDGGIPPRDAGKRGLTRVMTLGGAYGTRNYTVKGLRDQKGKRVLVETLPFSVEEAIAAEEAGIDTMKVRFDPNAPESAAAIRQAAPNTFQAFSVPLIAAASPEEAVRLGYAAMAVGADAIMCQWSPRFIEAAAEAGIPVQGHAGLVPRRSTWTGGLRAVGKTLDEAKWVYQEIKALENAGAYAVEVEVIPEALLAEISKRTSLMTSSIGGGSGGMGAVMSGKATANFLSKTTMILAAVFMLNCLILASISGGRGNRTAGRQAVATCRVECTLWPRGPLTPAS